MFQYCYALETAPMLLVQSLAADCFQGMFYSCTNLSSVRLVINDPEMYKSFNPQLYFFNWLNGAGTKADSPQLYLGGSIADYYFPRREELTNDYYIPENWEVQPL